MDKYNELKGIANRVAFDLDTTLYGVCITIGFDGEAYSYHIWTVKDGKTQSHRLTASCTSEERLRAHAEVFVENYR